MKRLQWTLLVFAALVAPGFSKDRADGADPAAPPARLTQGGWKASWSPDGGQIVYGKGQGQGLDRLDIVTRQITPVFARGKDPCWSPSGRRIAFVQEDSFNSYATEQVWLVGFDGKEPRRLVTGGFPGWSSDGKRVFAHSRQENKIIEVNAEDPTAQPVVFFPNASSWYFSVSPDETRIAFGCAGRLEIRDRATGKIVASWPTARERGLLPAWSPDGKLVAFGGFDGSNFGLWVMEPSGLKAVQVLKGDYTMPAWSRDSEWLAFDSRGGSREIWTVGRAYIEERLRDPKTAKGPE
jgi:Tol biopolymer transport system component